VINIVRVRGVRCQLWPLDEIGYVQVREVIFRFPVGLSFSNYPLKPCFWASYLNILVIAIYEVLLMFFLYSWIKVVDLAQLTSFE
jgi:hypothetical protein